MKTGVFKDFESIPARKAEGKSYQPQMSETMRRKIRAEWKTAVRRTLNEG